MWRLLAESVPGTSHARTNTPCQDSHKVTNYPICGSHYLVLACSDGAGSASHSDVGSRIACEAAVDEACRFLNTGASLAAVDRPTAISWLQAIRIRLAAEAEKKGVELRQLAATLLLAVEGPNTSVFLQIGDGAIVTFEPTPLGAGIRTVFWPQNGEYANTTSFLTDDKFGDLAMFERRDKCHTGIAAFTDGVQLLALDFCLKAAHRPFFEPFFKQLLDASEPDNLHIPFRHFLNSKQVNDRTDDDKTLVIAVRESDCAH